MPSHAAGSFGGTEGDMPTGRKARPEHGMAQHGALILSEVLSFFFKFPVRGHLNAEATKFRQSAKDRKFNVSADQPLATDHGKQNESAKLFCTQLYEALNEELDKTDRSTEFIEHVMNRLFWGPNAKLTLSTASLAAGELKDGQIINRVPIEVEDLDNKGGVDILYIRLRVAEYGTVGGNKPGINFKVEQMIVDKKQPREPLPPRVVVAPDDMDVEDSICL